MDDAGGNLEEQLGSVQEQVRWVEKEISRVEKEISRVEKEISRVEKEISRVEKEISRVEEEISGAKEDMRRVEVEMSGVEEYIQTVKERVEEVSDEQEKKQLRDEKMLLLRRVAQLGDEKARLGAKEARLGEEKAHLQAKEARLGDEKAHLQAKEAQLLQGRDLGTERDWLVQRVVVPDVPSAPGSYPSYSTKIRMYKPLKVEHWDVKGEIEEFLRRADNKKRAYRISVTSSTQESSKIPKFEGVVVSNIMSAVQDFVDKKQPQLKFRVRPQVALGSKLKKKDETEEADDTGMDEDEECGAKLIDFYIRNPRADFVITMQEKNALVVEVKNGGLGPDRGDPWLLHKAWTECSCIAGEGNPNCRCQVLGITAGHGERLIRCISQLYEYMALSKVGYGILTDARNWYLFKRDNAGCLKISIGFKAGGEHPPVLAAVLYLVDIASKDNSEFGKGPGHGETPKLRGAASSEPSSESSDDVKNDPDFRGRGSSTSVSERPRSRRTRSDGNQLAWKAVSGGT